MDFPIQPGISHLISRPRTAWAFFVIFRLLHRFASLFSSPLPAFLWRRGCSDAFLPPMPFFSRMRRHLFQGFLCFHARPLTFPSSGCRCGQSQPPNSFQNRPEQLSRHRHLRHLEDDLPGMAHDLRPDLDQFLPQRRQRPVTNRSGQHRLPQEVAQVTGSSLPLISHSWRDAAGHQVRKF